MVRRINSITHYSILFRGKIIMNNSIPDMEGFGEEIILEDVEMDQAIQEFNTEAIKDAVVEELESDLSIAESERKWLLTDYQADKAIELFANNPDFNEEIAEGIKEFSKEAIEEAINSIEKEPRLEIHNKKRLELLGELLAAKNSLELKNEEKTASPQKNLPPAKMTTPKKMEEFHKKMEENELFKGKPGRATKITKAEHLEATKEGLSELIVTMRNKFLELEKQSGFQTYAIDNQIIRQRVKIGFTEKILEEIDNQLKTLPSNPTAIPIEQFPEWQRDIIHTERRNKEVKLKTHKDMVAAGIEFSGKFGMDAIGAVSNAQDDLYKELPAAKNYYPEEQILEEVESTDESSDLDEEFVDDSIINDLDFDGSIIDSSEDMRS